MDGLEWENLLKWMIWGVFPLFLATPMYFRAFIGAVTPFITSRGPPSRP